MSLRINNILQIAILAFSIIFVQCSDKKTQDKYDIFQSAKLLWEEKAIENYSIYQSYDSWGPEEIENVQITVEQDSIVEIIESETETILDTTYWTRYRTIDELFDEVENYIDSKNVELTIEYDELYGFPTLLNIYSDAQPTDINYSIISWRINSNE